MRMKISDIGMLRDGGTILFTLLGTHNSGRYRLQTPFRGEPRPIFVDDRQLEFGSRAEHELLTQLREWLNQSMTENKVKALHTLDMLKEWRNLPSHLLDAVPLHRIRTVLECLDKRNATPSPEPGSNLSAPPASSKAPEEPPPTN